MVWYCNGSADDPVGKSGIAHFLEHLMFKGTARYPAGVFSKTLAALGGQENAFTSYDYTAYFQRVAREHLAAVMDYEADRMTGLAFDEDVVAPERDVVLEERRMRVDADPGAQLSEEMTAALFTHHPYGLPIIGWEHEISDLQHADAFAYYRRFYTPDNAILVVAGDTDVDEVRPLAERIYGPIAPTGAAPVGRRLVEPPARAARTVTVADARVRQPILYRQFAAPSYGRATGDEAFALDLALDIMGGGATSRLYRDLVVEGGVASNVSGSYWGSMLDSGRISLSAVPSPGVTLEALEAALNLAVERFLASGPTEAELRRSRTRLVADTIYARDSQSSLARLYGSSLAVGDSIEDIERWPERLEAVTAGQVVAAARAHVDLRRGVTGRLMNA
ncbi:MAG: insulinase family protein [Bosea sp.]|nr:insulinase family protein [Bosea sp. (in: a-proteobacteria)]